MSYLFELIMLLFALLIFAQAGNKLALEETEVPIVAKATREMSILVCYRGQIRAGQPVRGRVGCDGLIILADMSKTTGLAKLWQGTAL